MTLRLAARETVCDDCEPVIRILTFSTLYPNAARPGHGPFVEHRLRQLLGTGEVASTVVAPVPWFPSRNPLFGEYAGFAAAPHEETRHGIHVLHPRYPVIPKIGMNLAPALLERFSRRAVAEVLNNDPAIRLLDAHYFYPDGVAAAMLGERMGLPVFITARGTDINLIPEYARPRRRILWAAERAAGIITVCSALKDTLVEMGVDGSKITVLRNGVDFDLFSPVPETQARAQTGMEANTLLSVGLLIERKGHHLIIEALSELPGVRLVIVGDGPQRGALEALASRLEVAERVHFAGRIPQDQLPAYYSAANALILASSREGMANVLLESLACGTPVVATPLWGTPEVVADPAAGVLMQDRSAASIVSGVRQLFDNYPLPADTLSYSKRFSWDDTSRGQIKLFDRVKSPIA
ncbi:MAG: glycosyltransferase family 4 protein [Gammaproteobacteria bacterium]|nr:glycosyltransferase family 4 protein [Gammaproteobacteria bacterium]